MTTSRTIDLTIGEADFSFCLSPQDVTKYFNAMTPTNKVAPAHNLLTRTVKTEQKDALVLLLGNPLLVMQVAGTLLEEYSPDVEVTVKKHSATLNA